MPINFVKVNQNWIQVILLDIISQDLLNDIWFLRGQNVSIVFGHFMLFGFQMYIFCRNKIGYQPVWMKFSGWWWKTAPGYKETKLLVVIKIVICKL